MTDPDIALCGECSEQFASPSILLIHRAGGECRNPREAGLCAVPWQGDLLWTLPRPVPQRRRRRDDGQMHD